MAYETDSTNRESLVVRARCGDTDALEQLLRASYPPLLRTALRLLRDDDAAQDVVQETLIRIARRLDQLAEPAAYPGWARTILRRETQEYFRRRQRNPLDGFEYDDSRLEVLPDEPSAFAPSEEMDQCLGLLRRDDRSVLDLHYWGGLEASEIAAGLGIAVGAVKTRLFRARNRLRDRLCELESTLVPQA